MSTQAGASGGALRSAQRGQSVVGAGAISDPGSGQMLWGCRLGLGIEVKAENPSLEGVPAPRDPQNLATPLEGRARARYVISAHRPLTSGSER